MPRRGSAHNAAPVPACSRGGRIFRMRDRFRGRAGLSRAVPGALHLYGCYGGER